MNPDVEAPATVDKTVRAQGAHQDGQHAEHSTPAVRTVSVERLTEEINQAHARCNQRKVQALQDARLCGELLAKVRERLGYGHFGQYVDEHFPFGRRQARKYLRLFRGWDRLDVSVNKPETIDDAMALLVEPDSKRHSNAALGAEAEALADQAAEASNLSIDATRRAFEHLRRAGEALLKAKVALSDDDWLPWLAANTIVTEAQAQRCMALAAGEAQADDDPMALAAYLQQLPALDPACQYATVEPDGVTTVIIEPAAADGFWFVTRINSADGEAEGLRRPIAREYVSHALVGLGVTASSDWKASPAQERIERNRWLHGDGDGASSVR